MDFYGVRLEKGLREICNFSGIIGFAAEYVDVGGIREVSKMPGNNGGLDKLNHRISCNTLIFAKIDHLTVAEAPHINKVTQLHHVTPDLIGVSDKYRITVVDI
jgi:hypothetical protein